MTAPAIAASDLWVAYGPTQVALAGVSLEIPTGGVSMLLGPSGSGKSTFLKTVRGLLVPSRGSLAVLGRPVTGGRPSNGNGTLAIDVAYIPQHLGLVRTLSALDNTLMGALGRSGTCRSLVKLFPQAELDEAEALLASVGLAHKAREAVYRLSGGERQRVAIARALMQQPRLVLADEFVSHLDPVTTADIMRIVSSWASRGVTFLITSHQIELAAAHGDRAIVLRGGRIVHDGPARAMDARRAAELMAAS